MHVVTLLVALVTWRHLAPGPCFGDCGDLQLGAATAGIMHPPGYALYTALTFPLTLLPGIEPAWTVNLLCWFAGLACVQLSLRLVIRLGGDVFLGTAGIMLWMMEHEVWIGFVSPEVYLPTTLLVLCAAWSAGRFEDCGRTRFALLAATLLGIALANRPGVVLYLLGTLPILAALSRKQNTSGKQRRALVENGANSESEESMPKVLQAEVPQQGNIGFTPQPTAGSTGSAAGSSATDLTPGELAEYPQVSGWSLKRPILFAICLVTPAFVAAGITIARDSHAASYNYLVEYNREHQVLPPPDSWQHSVERARWLMTGREFKGNTIESWPDLARKWRWLKGRIAFNRLARALPIPLGRTLINGILAVAVLLALMGVLIKWRKSPVVMAVIAGACLGSFAYTSLYTVQGDGADVIPLGLTGMMLASIGVTALLQPNKSHARRAVVVITAILAMTFFAVDAGRRPSTANYNDAERFLAELELATVPENAVILCSWRDATTLWYAERFLVKRDDVDVIRRTPVRWFEVVDRFEGRPVFSTAAPPHAPGYSFEPFRNLYRWHSDQPADEQPTSDQPAYGQPAYDQPAYDRPSAP